MDDDTKANIEKAASLLRGVQRVAVLSGAGISKESGVPTFREAQHGLWARYDPQQLATPDAFRRDPDLVWRWYMYRRRLIEAVAPNPGHMAIAHLEALFPQVTVITQNIDGMHAKAGSTTIVELHGSIYRWKCSELCGGETMFVDLGTLDYNEEHAPPCPHCEEGGYVRPDVVWFGEMLPRAALEQALDEAAQCDVMLVVGTSAMVEPAASLPRIAKKSGKRLIEVNPEGTPISHLADAVLRAPSGVALPMLLAALNEEGATQ